MKKSKVIEKNGKFFVVFQKKGEDGKIKRAMVRTYPFPEGHEPAFITVSYSMTKNLGNYESAKIQVGLTLPCYPEEVEEKYPEVRQFVEEKLMEEIAAFDIKEE